MCPSSSSLFRDVQSQEYYTPPVKNYKKKTTYHVKNFLDASPSLVHNWFGSLFTGGVFFMSHEQEGATQDDFNQRIRQKDEGALPHGAELAERGPCSRRGRKNAPGRGGGQLLGNPSNCRKDGKAKAWA